MHGLIFKTSIWLLAGSTRLLRLLKARRTVVHITGSLWTAAASLEARRRGTLAACSLQRHFFSLSCVRSAYPLGEYWQHNSRQEVRLLLLSRKSFWIRLRSCLSGREQIRPNETIQEENIPAFFKVKSPFLYDARVMSVALRGTLERRHTHQGAEILDAHTIRGQGGRITVSQPVSWILLSRLGSNPKSRTSETHLPFDDAPDSRGLKLLLNS